MRIGILVQARTSSARLPGKVLMSLAGRPVLAWLVERMKRVGTAARAGCHAVPALPVVVATSLAPEDDAVEALARSLEVGCYRGPLEDVASRLYQAAQAAGLSAFVRVNADSPMLDPVLVERAYALFLESACDMVTNVYPRSFPRGMSVELITMQAMRKVLDETEDAADREHVTRYVYGHPDRFTIRNFESPHPCPELQLAIDTQEDFVRMEACLSRLGKRALEAGWEEVVEIGLACG